MTTSSAPLGEGPPAIGSVLEERYRLVGELGAGGIGWVFRAEHLKLGHHVAIKMLQTQFVGHDLMRPRFEREAKALALLSHPNIVTLTDYSVADDRPYLVMELLEGRPLGALVDEGPIPEERARPILRQILEALAFAHGRGLVHRDLKPDNVFLVAEPPDFVKLLDFGFVKLLDASLEEAASAVLTRSGVVFGTPAYMSPEQVAADKTGPSTDVYSLGILVFEMLAGERPFRGENTDVVRQHLTADLPPLRVRSLEAGPELRAWLTKATAKRPEERFPSAVEMLEAFDAIPEGWMRVSDESAHAHTLISEAPAQAPPAQAPTSGVRRRRGGSWLLAALVAGVALAIGFTVLHDVAGDSTAGNPEAAAIEASGGHASPIAASVASLGRNPFASRPPVPLLTDADAAIARGRTLPDATERALKDWARANHGDPRPHLILAIHYFNRRYNQDAIERFRLAQHVSPDARNDPRMLELLLRLASSGNVTDAAADAIASIYGSTAKPALRSELARTGLAPAVIARLEALDRRL